MWSENPSEKSQGDSVTFGRLLLQTKIERKGRKRENHRPSPSKGHDNVERGILHIRFKKKRRGKGWTIGNTCPGGGEFISGLRERLLSSSLEWGGRTGLLELHESNENGRKRCRKWGTNRENTGAQN